MKIRVISEECTACGDCVEVCPIDAVVLEDDLAVILEHCNFCGLCVTACPVEAIEMTRPEAVKVAGADASSGVWVFAEQRQGRLAGVARELMAKGLRKALLLVVSGILKKEDGDHLEKTKAALENGAFSSQ